MDVNVGKMGMSFDKQSEVPTVLSCYMKCGSDPECKYWSYIEPTYSGGSHSTCFIKSTQDWTESTPAAQKGITSGAKSKICPGFEHSDTTSEKNSVYNSTSVPTIINSFFVV